METGVPSLADVSPWILFKVVRVLQTLQKCPRLYKKNIRSCHAPTSDALWLPIALGIKSRFLTMAYKILRDMAPASSVVCYHCLLCQIPSLLASVWFLRYAVIFHLSLCL